MKPEIIRLIGETLDGTISPANFSALQDHMRHDPDVLRTYSEQSEIYGRLTWELKLKSEAVANITMRPSDIDTTPIINIWHIWQYPRTMIASATAIAAAITLTAVYWILQPASTTPSALASTPHNGSKASNVSTVSTGSLARITNTQEAHWKNASLQIGSWLTPGTIQLLSGQAEITFDSGARVVLQGPATLDCLNARLANLTQGKGVVHIPKQAEGFQLKTPSNTFTDQACTFALAVDHESTEIHVFKGSIEARPRDNMAITQTLSSSQALRLNHTSMLANNAIRYDSSAFQQEIAIPSKHPAATYLRWSFDTMQLDSFPETGHHEKARYPAKIQQLARIPGEAHAQSIKGKFGQALRFNGQGSYLSTQFPGISGTRERTVSCWVRIPKNATGLQAYSFFSWGKPQSQTGSKWQISWNPGGDNTGTYGAIRTEFGGGYVIGSTNLRDNRWHHITSVYLGGQSNDVATQVLHYIDGKLESVTASKYQTINTQTHNTETSLAYIGRRLEKDNFSSFKGDIDELHVFPAALTPHQIQMLYRHNQTPQTLIPSLATQ